MNKHPIEAYMSEFPVVASPETTVTRAIDLMKECGVRHLPVVSAGRIVGVISERDLRQAELLAEAMVLNVSDYMTPRPFCVPPASPLGAVVREMFRNRWGCAVVCDAEMRVRGIFTTTDALELLADFLDRGKASLPNSSIEDFLTRQRVEAAATAED